MVSIEKFKDAIDLETRLKLIEDLNEKRGDFVPKRDVDDDYQYDKLLFEPSEKLLNKANECVQYYLSPYFGWSLHSYLKFHNASVFHCKDDATPVHADTPAVPHGFRPIICLAYLNDDFQGGELIFPMQKEVISPSAGSLIIFPAFFTYPHQVTYTYGDRYMLRLDYLVDEAKENIFIKT